MKHRRRKGIRAVILALATAAILVPAASGKIYEGGSVGYVEVHQSSDSVGVKGTTEPQAYSAQSQGGTKLADSYEHSYTPQALQAMNERWTKRAEAYQRARPDDRAGVRGIGTVTTSDYVDRQMANLQAKAALVAKAMHVDDRVGIHGPGPVETPSVASSHGDGFDWTDAGIGASVALVAAIILAAVALARRRPGLAV
jgi:hypothetical protein